MSSECPLHSHLPDGVWSLQALRKEEQPFCHFTLIPAGQRPSRSPGAEQGQGSEASTVALRPPPTATSPLCAAAFPCFRSSLSTQPPLPRACPLCTGAHSLTHACIHSLSHSFTHSFTHSLLIHSFTHSFIYSLTQPLISHLFSHSLIHEASVVFRGWWSLLKVQPDHPEHRTRQMTRYGRVSRF